MSENWKRPCRLAFVTVLIFFVVATLLFFNEYHVRVGFEFKFQSDPRTATPPANPALEAHMYEQQMYSRN